MVVYFIGNNPACIIFIIFAIGSIFMVVNSIILSSIHYLIIIFIPLMVIVFIISIDLSSVSSFLAFIFCFVSFYLTVVVVDGIFISVLLFACVCS